MDLSLTVQKKLPSSADPIYPVPIQFGFWIGRMWTAARVLWQRSNCITHHLTAILQEMTSAWQDEISEPFCIMAVYLITSWASFSISSSQEPCKNWEHLESQICKGTIGELMSKGNARKPDEQRSMSSRGAVQTTALRVLLRQGGSPSSENSGHSVTLNRDTFVGEDADGEEQFLRTFCMAIRCRLTSEERHHTVMQMLRSFGPSWARQGVLHLCGGTVFACPCQGVIGLSQIPASPPTPFLPIKSIPTQAETRWCSWTVYTAIYIWIPMEVCICCFLGRVLSCTRLRVPPVALHVSQLISWIL